MLGNVARVLSVAVLALAVTVGVIGRVKPELFLRIPEVGFIPWALTGNRMPPYFDEACLHKENWKGEKGDIVVSSGAKAGTLWLQTIVLLLRSNGWDDFDAMNDYYGTCEMLAFPEETMEMRMEKTENKRAVAKEKGFVGFQIFTHKFPGTNPTLVGLDPKLNPDVKYIAIVRNGKEVLKSFLDFMNSHTKKFRDMWGGFPPPMDGPEAILKFAVDDMPDFYFGHLKAWWDFKDEPNVLLLHYRNMRSDPAGSIRQIASFLEIPLTDDLFETVLRKSSLEYMSNPPHPNKYTGFVGYPDDQFSFVEEHGHIRPGGGKLVDHTKEDNFFTEEMLAKWEAAMQKHFGHDPALVEFANTGSLPSMP